VENPHRPLLGTVARIERIQHGRLAELVSGPASGLIPARAGEINQGSERITVQQQISPQLDAILSRLDSPKPTNTGRWRAACPVCGGKNRSTLSVGVGDTGAVLLRCWKSGCDPEQIAHAVGLDLADLFPPRDSPSSPPLKRRRLVSAAQALDLIHGEAMLVMMCASDMGHGETLDEDHRQRLLKAAARIGLLLDEARS
jgi:hypothetical protein